MVKKINQNDFSFSNNNLTLLDFYADWCGPCRMISPVIEEISEIVTDVDFRKVNVEENQHLSNAFQIMSIPTLVLLKDGKEVGRQVGFANKKSLINWIEANK